tara:strand:- start:98489 stop:98701 length:213 start_codon:yes stop_codon:yes gene_type:complete
MFHPLAIVLVLKTLIYFNLNNIGLQYLLTLITTIFISGMSYKYFESYFIKKKTKFSKILSGDNFKNLETK